MTVPCLALYRAVTPYRFFTKFFIGSKTQNNTAGSITIGIIRYQSICMKYLKEPWFGSTVFGGKATQMPRIRIRRILRERPRSLSPFHAFQPFWFSRWSPFIP